MDGTTPGRISTKKEGTIEITSDGNKCGWWGRRDRLEAQVLRQKKKRFSGDRKYRSLYGDYTVRR
jgi:hypothetical protein